MCPGWYKVLGDHWLNVRGDSHSPDLLVEGITVGGNATLSDQRQGGAFNKTKQAERACQRPYYSQ